MGELVDSQSNCLFTNQLVIRKGSSQPCSPLRAQKFDLMAVIHWYDSLSHLTKPVMDPPGKTLCIWPTLTPEIK